MEGTHSPLATTSAFNLMEDMGQYLRNGCMKVVGFGDKTDALLEALPQDQKNAAIDVFHSVFTAALQKCSKHWDEHPAKEIFRKVRASDPRQVPAVSNNIDMFAVFGLNHAMNEEFLIYCNAARNDLPALAPGEEFDIAGYWQAMAARVPQIAQVARQYIFYPVSSADTERSFSKYKNLVTNKRERVTPENTKQLVTMNFNGDVTGRWKDYM